MKLKHLFVGFVACISWGSFAQNTYTLEQFIAEMLANDFGILLLRNDAEIAKNNNNPGAAGYLPTVGLTADQNWSSNNTRQEFFSGQINQADAAKNRSTNAALRVNWTIFDGFRMFATDKRLELLESISSIDLNAEMEMKIYQASALFFTFLQQQKMRDVYREALEVSRTRYNQTALKRTNGAASEIQLIQARLDLTADSAAFLANERSLQNLQVDLNRFLARDILTPIQVTGELLFDQTLTWESYWQTANEQNTAILRAKSALAVRNLERKELQSFFFPQVALYGQYVFGRSQNEVGILNSNRTFGPGAGITLQWNILDRLSTYTALKNNELQQKSAAIAIDNQTNLVQTELRKAWNEYAWARQNIALEQQNITASESTVAIYQEAFRNGSITALELREIQFSVVQAKSRLIQAELALKTAELNLSLLSGNFKKLIP